MSEYRQSSDIANEAERLRRIAEWGNQVTLSSLSFVAGEDISTILVAGCGTGAEFEPLAATFPDAEIFGVDKSERVLAIAASTGKARTVQADVTELSSAPEIAEHGPFDLFFARQVLFHIQNPAVVLEEAKKVVRPGGTVFAQEPNWNAAQANWADFGVYTDAVTRTMRAFGINPALGQTLRQLFDDAGLTGLVEQTHTKKVEDPEDPSWDTLGYFIDVAGESMLPFLEEHGIDSTKELRERLEKARKVPKNFFIPPSWVVVAGTNDPALIRS